MAPFELQMAHLSSEWALFELSVGPFELRMGPFEPRIDLFDPQIDLLDTLVCS